MLFEFVVGDDGFVFDPGFVGVDGVNGIVEDAGDLFIFVDTHSDECEDAEVGVEELVVLVLDLIFFAEQVVKAMNEVGEELEKYFIEIQK